MTNNNKIRIGILSAASIVERFIEGVNNSDNAEVVALATNNSSKLHYLKQKYDIAYTYNDYESLYNSKQFDLMYIPIYNKEHYNAAKKALEHGYHVLLEKPFTLDVYTANELFQIAKKKNLFIMEAQKALFLPLTNTVKELLTNNSIGQIRAINVTISYPNLHNQLSWFLDRDAGGGTLYGSGCYPLHYIMYVLNTTISKSSAISNLYQDKTDTTYHQIVEFSNGVVASIHMTTEYKLDNQITFYGDKGTIKVPSFWKARNAILTVDDTITEINEPFVSDFTPEINHITNCINDKLLTSPIMTYKITLDTIKVIEDTYKLWYK